MVNPFYTTNPRKIQFYETDLMGIVHHSNYLRIFEEARVAWAVEKGLLNYQQASSAFQLAVVETNVRHLQALKFGDEIQVEVQACQQKIRIVFEYKLYARARNDKPFATCKTVHVALDTDLNVMRVPKTMQAILEKEKWTETWL